MTDCSTFHANAFWVLVTAVINYTTVLKIITTYVAISLLNGCCRAIQLSVPVISG